MKKVCALLFVQLLVFGTASYSSVSNDVYVRRDVFEAKLRNITANQERILQKLDNLEGDMSNLFWQLDGLDKRMDGFDKRMDDLRSDMYMCVGLLLLAMIVFSSTAQSHKNNMPSITLEDVERLIDKKLSGNIQA